MKTNTGSISISKSPPILTPRENNVVSDIADKCHVYQATRLGVSVPTIQLTNFLLSAYHFVTK